MQLDTRRFRPHQVLGDAQQYQAALDQQKRLQETNYDKQQHVADSSATEEETLASIDPLSVPADVWAAAQLLGDKGIRLVRIYRELADQRNAAVEQMTLNQTRRAQEQQQQRQQLSCISPQQTSSSSSSSTLKQHGSKQLCRSPSPPGLARPAPTGSSNVTAWQDNTATYQLAGSTAALGRLQGAAPGQLLSKRTIMDSIVESHDERVLARWEAQQAAWDAQAAALAAATGKQPKDLTIARGDEWRRKLELLSALEVAVPAAAAAKQKANKTRIMNSVGGYQGPNSDGGSKGSVRDGDTEGTIAAASGNWMATLRNANERYVMINNVFTGLFLSLHNRNSVAAAGLTTIRRPTLQQSVPTITTATEPPNAAVHSECCPASVCNSIGSTADASSSSSSSSVVSAGAVRRRSWMDDAYLKQKLTDGSAAVKAIAASAPDAEGLVVCGQSLDCAALAVSLAVRPVALKDVEKRLAVADPGLFTEYQAAKQAEAARAAAAAAAEAEQARRAAARTAPVTYPRPGPNLEAGTDCLSLYYMIPPAGSSSGSGSSSATQPVLVDSTGAVLGAGGSSCGESSTAASAELTVNNTGTTAVYYSWSCTGRPRALQAAAGQGGAAAAAGLQDSEDGGHMLQAWMPEIEEKCMFYLPNQKGVILPGEFEKFRFSFKSSSPGIYQESWSMSTHPPLQPIPHAPVGSEARKKGHTIGVTLKGLAVTESAAGSDACGQSSIGLEQRQRQLEERLSGTSRTAQVQSILNLLLDNALHQVAQHHKAAAKQQHNAVSPDEVAAAAKWAAANPAVTATSSSSSSSNNQAAAVSTAGSSEAVTAAARPGSVRSTAMNDAAEVVQCYDYYHPDVVIRLGEIYNKAALLLQPPAPQVDTKKVRPSTIGMPHSTLHTAPSLNTAKDSSSTSKGDTDPTAAAAAAEFPPLPETWDLSVSGLRGVLARLAAAPAHKQAAAVLKQQAEVALKAAAVPNSQTDMVTAATRQVLLQLADAVAAAADTARAASVIASDSGGAAPGHTTHRVKQVNNAAAAADEHSSSSGSGNGSSGSGADSSGAGHTGTSHGGKDGSSSSSNAGAATHRARGTAAAAGPLINQEQYDRLLNDGVWTAARQQFGAFEKVLGQYQAAAAAQLDAAVAEAAAAAGQMAAADAAIRSQGGLDDAAAAAVTDLGSEMCERVAWAQFVAIRRKRQLGLPM